LHLPAKFKTFLPHHPCLLWNSFPFCDASALGACYY